MKNKLWNLNKQLENKYRKTLLNIFAPIIKEAAKKKVVDEIVSYLLSVFESKEFIDTAIKAAVGFINHANAIDYKTWRVAAREESKGRQMYEQLQKDLQKNVGVTMAQKIDENAKYITNTPIELSKQVTNYVAKETLKGRRAEEIAKELCPKLDQYSKARINTIARTEASKATTALTQARSKDVGVEWYQWRTANDGNRVRDSHQIMQGVLVRWNDAPAPEVLNGEKSAGHYHAGDIYNCRCYPAPVILLSSITWPAKVYYNGTITKMSKTQFEKIM